MGKTRRVGFSRKRRRGGRKTVKRRGGRRRSRVRKRRGGKRRSRVTKRRGGRRSRRVKRGGGKQRRAYDFDEDDDVSVGGYSVRSRGGRRSRIRRAGSCDCQTGKIKCTTKRPPTWFDISGKPGVGWPQGISVQYNPPCEVCYTTCS